MIDTHAHLFNEYYDDIQGILDKAKSKGIDKVIVAADNIKTCYEVIEHAKKFDNYYFCLGIHPENVDDSLDELKQIIEDNKDNPKFVGIGEIGLDYYWTKDNKDKQIYFFEKQLELAEKYNLPVIIHSRKASQDVYDILKKFNVKGSMHCYAGSLEMAKEFIKLGFLIGIDGPITFKNNKKGIEVVKEIPIDRLLLETDSPYLSPEPNRGKQNSPLNLIYIAEKISEIKGITVEEVIDITTKNAKELFNL